MPHNDFSCVVTGLHNFAAFTVPEDEELAYLWLVVMAAPTYHHMDFGTEFPYRFRVFGSSPMCEVRGSEALDLLKAWGTGHPGGVGTIHAGSALGALRRMEQLIQEAVITVPRALLAETIDLVVVLVRDGTGRRLSELAGVDGLDPATGEYRLTALITPKGENR